MLGWIFFRAAAWLTLALVLVVVQQVVARYWFSASSIGLQELSWHIYGLIFLWAAATTYRDGEQVRVDVFYGKLSGKQQAMINLWGTVVFLWPMAFILMVYGWQFATDAWAFANPRPPDYYSQAWREFWFYDFVAPIEGWVRRTVLIGEISPNPGGLEGRWLMKAMIPLAGLLLMLASLGELKKSFNQWRGRS